MEAIHDSAVERRRDNLIYALSGTAWPYCLSMSAALPENMRGLAFGSAIVLLVRVLVRRCVGVACVDAPTLQRLRFNVLEAARGSD